MKLSWRFLPFLGVVILLFSGIGLLSQEEEDKEDEETGTVYDSFELFSRVLVTVEKKYIEEVDHQKLIYGALQGMLSSLDPYSQFLEPDIYNEIKVGTKGKFGGLGIEIAIRDDVLTVITPIEDTPASRAGLQPGDKIAKIEGKSTKNITLMEAVKKLRGKPGTEVSITILRPGERELLEFTIVRDIIHIESVKEAKMLEDGIGYIRLAQFQENTMEDFNQALEQLQEEGLKALILDLRFNPGGLLSTAIGIADRFLNRGQIIVRTLGRGDKVEMEVKATGRNVLPDFPLVVLINEGSASGSEIVAGALRDNHRAVLVGTKTFGKGSVQSVLSLPDDSGIRLTTGHYYTASQKPIQDKGIEPDIEVTMTDQEKRDFYLKKYRALEKMEEKIKKKEEGEKEGEDVEPEGTPEEGEKGEEAKEILDPQLKKAVSILKGILILQDFQKEAKIES